MIPFRGQYGFISFFNNHLSLNKKSSDPQPGPLRTINPALNRLWIPWTKEVNIISQLPVKGPVSTFHKPGSGTK